MTFSGSVRPCVGVRGLAADGYYAGAFSNIMQPGMLAVDPALYFSPPATHSRRERAFNFRFVYFSSAVASAKYKSFNLYSHLTCQLAVLISFSASTADRSEINIEIKISSFKVSPAGFRLRNSNTRRDEREKDIRVMQSALLPGRARCLHTKLYLNVQLGTIISSK